MRPGRPEGANRVWPAPGEVKPCEVCSGDGSDECPGCWGSGRAGDMPVRIDGDTVTSAWLPDTGERKALANGAPVLLHVTAEPPSMEVEIGEPSVVVRPLLDGRHVEEAVRDLIGAYAERSHAGDEPDDAEVLRMWHKALVANTPEGNSISSRRGAG